MPKKDDAKFLRDIGLESLNNFPRMLDSHMDLVDELGRKLKKKKSFSATEMLENWNQIDNLKKFYYVGWFRGALKKIGFTRAMIFIHLADKQKIDAAMANMLNGATEEELKAFRDGEDLANNQR